MNKAILLCTIVSSFAVSAYADSPTGVQPSFKAAVAAAEGISGVKFAAAKAAKEEAAKKEAEGYAALDEDFPDTSPDDKKTSASKVADSNFGTMYDENTGEEVKNVEYKKTPVNYSEETSMPKSSPTKKGKKKNDHNIMAMSDDRFEEYKKAALVKRQERAAKKAQSKNNENLELNNMFDYNEKMQTQAPVISMPVQPESSDVQAQISALEEEAQLFVERLRAIREGIDKNAKTVAAVKAALGEPSGEASVAVAVRD